MNLLGWNRGHRTPTGSCKLRCWPTRPRERRLAAALLNMACHAGVYFEGETQGNRRCCRCNAVGQKGARSRRHHVQEVTWGVSQPAHASRTTEQRFWCCRRPLLEVDEEELLLAKAGQMVADGMPGKSATKLGAEARNLCRKLAEGEPDEGTYGFASNKNEPLPIVCACCALEHLQSNINWQDLKHRPPWQIIGEEMLTTAIKAFGENGDKLSFMRHHLQEQNVDLLAKPLQKGAQPTVFLAKPIAAAIRRVFEIEVSRVL